MKAYLLNTMAAIAAFSFMAASCDGIYDRTREDGEGTETPDNPDDPSGDDPSGDDPMPEEYFYYQEVTSDMADWSGNYLICNESSKYGLIVFASWSEGTYGQPASDESGQYVDLNGFMTADGIPAEDADIYRSVISPVGSHYSIYVTGAGYIGYTGGGNTLAVTDTEPDGDDAAWLWDLSYDDCSNIVSVADPSRKLQWNSSHPRFSTYTGSQQEIVLYRSTAGGAPVPPGPGDDPDPDNPDPDIPDVPSGNGKYGWYELPAMDITESSGYLVDSSNPDLYYAYHLCDGNEKGPGEKRARNYTVCYSAEHHCPVWVAAPRHAMYETKGTERTNAYKPDPNIPSSIQLNSKSTGGGCNKGHMLGSAERISSAATNRQVFYYSNIAPQRSSNFNTGGGGWNTLEDWVDKKVCQDTLYVVIGAYFDEYEDARGYSDTPARISFGGRDDVSRPTMYYYILLRTKSGNTGKSLSECSSDELMCAAFVRSHNTPMKVSVSEKEMMSVSDLEKITGVTYFASVPNAPKDSFEASDWGL